MQSRLISIVTGLALVLGIGFLVYGTKKPIVLSIGSGLIPVETIQRVPGSGITLSQIASHSSRSNCWSAINGSVYDLTSWTPNHPGGEQVILSLCGRDGSNDYNAQHGGQSKPATILAGFKIGILVN